MAGVAGEAGEGQSRNLCQRDRLPGSYIRLRRRRSNQPRYRDSNHALFPTHPACHRGLHLNTAYRRE